MTTMIGHVLPATSPFAAAATPPQVWVNPVRITTGDGDVIHGGQWPDGRIYAWDAGISFAEAWPGLPEFQATAAEEGWTVAWAGPPDGVS